MSWLENIFSIADDDDAESETSTKSGGIDTILVAGDNVHSFTASEDLERGEAVSISNDYGVSPCNDIEDMYGVALFDVVENEHVAVVERPAILRLVVDGDISSGDGVGLEDSTTWIRNNDKKDIAIVHGLHDNDIADIELRPHS